MAAKTTAINPPESYPFGNDEEESCSFYCDTWSSHLSISSGSGDGNDEHDDEKKRLQDPKENRVITILRVALIAVLIISGILVSTSLYMYANKHNQTNALERSEDQMEAIARGFSYKVSRVVQELDRLAVELRVLARYSNNGGGSPWPYVVFPDFEQMASKTRKAANLDSVAFLPLVNTEGGSSSGGGGIVNNKVVAWSKYAAEHLQDWLSVSLSLQGDEVTDEEGERGTDGKHVFTNFPATTKNGPVGLPLWQLSPPVPQTSAYGEDLLGNAGSKKREDSARVVRVLEQVLASGNAVVGESIHVAPWEQQPSSKESEGSFFGTIAYPIILDGQEDITTNGQIVGVLLATVPWRSLLHDVTEEQRMGHTEDDDDTATNFVCVLENEYNQTMNYLLHPTATTSETMAYGTVPAGGPVGIVSDLIVDTQKILADSEESVVALDGDHYKLQIYPTVGASPTDGYAAAYAVVAALIFLFTTMLFLTYDRVVQGRQKDILKAAVRSTQLVSSLFPAQVRDRLLQQHKGPASDAGDKNDDSEAPYDLPAMNEMEKGSDQGNNMAATISASSVRSKIDNKGAHGGDHLGKPIADLYPNCTVLFSDISGFTAWSSQRSPTQVFTLLQNVFHAFDKVARKRGVYKVETIGDSYVAVTGLPDPQSDHAVIMAAFALECQHRLNEVTRKLERALGPDTSSLSMRFGLHSGPVTAGVLIGERARFQLFGDTVNTAARMESTGRIDAVQVSESTANLLIEAGKSHWVTQREDLVQVKGKGEMRTYWLESRGARTAVGSCDSVLDVCEENSIATNMLTEEECIPAGEHESAAVVSSESQNPPTRGMLRAQGGEVWGTSDIFGVMPPALERRRSSDPLNRLIDWNVDLLTDLLKKVIAQRMSQSESGAGEAPFIPPSITGHTIDEVTEIIELPGFDPSKYGSKQVDPQSVEIDDDVVEQLQEYVTMIAMMYRDNPFHNYEHACHVQMSMMKLIQRIVSSKSESSAGADSQSEDLDNYTYGITSDPLTQFACVLSALVHDCDHTGVSNGQLVKEGAPVATLYNNISVAEQNSVDLAWELLMDDKNEDLRQCIFTNEIEYKKFRHLLVNVVLATDIFDPKLSAARKARWNAAFSKDAPAEAESPVDRANRKATIVIEHLIQASDVSHTMQHWEIYRKWNERLFFEMYSAFQTGRMEKDPSTFWYQGELGFFDNCIIPLARKLQQCHVFGVSSDECLNYALENRRIWADKGQQIVAEMIATDFFVREKAAHEKKNRRSRRRKKIIA